MPDKNQLYRKYSKLANSAKGRALLNTIAEAEGTGGVNGYHKMFGGKLTSNLKDKPRGIKVKDGSSAAGKYQFLDSSWDRAKKALGLTDFSEKSQDAAAMWLADVDSNAVKELNKGNHETAIFEAGKIWQGLPKNENGDAIVGKGKQPQKSRVNPSEAKNIFLKSLNMSRAYYGNYNDENRKESKRVRKQFTDAMAEIESQDISDLDKNDLKNALIQETYDSGNLEIINHAVDFNNKRFDHFEKTWPAWEKADPKQKAALGITTKEEWEQKRTRVRQIENVNGVPVSAYPTKRETRYNLNDYAQQELDDYEELQPEEGTTAFDDEETEAEKAKRAKDKADAIAEFNKSKEKAFQPEDLLNRFADDSMIQDPKFQYNPGKQELPVDSLVNLGLGVMGMAAGDIDIQYRDEKISEGMLNFASELEQIKNIGLPPEIEGDLKMKLESAYQVGLENIVRASNGNRNLVLGNQGQLDQARMKGIVDIATMDVERRDKAMMAYGEVQKYINEFNANRDIANNERRYKEDEKKQLGASVLAQQGMSALVDSIQAQRENAPGSANDMMKQFLMFHISGINPNAKPGEPGHPDYLAQVEKEKKLAQVPKDRMAEFAKGISKENQEDLYTYLKENPNEDPSVNKNADVEKVINLFTEAGGGVSNKDNFVTEQGINPVEVQMAKQEVKPDAQPKPEEKPVNVFEEVKSIIPTASVPNPIITTQSPSDKAMKSYLDGGQELTNAIETAQKANHRYRNANAEFEQYILNQKK